MAIARGSLSPLLLCTLAACGATDAPAPPARAPASQDERMAWWREARFGLFVHWGLYAIPAGRWQGAAHHGEWIRDTARIPREVYDEWKASWNPVAFDADAWARAARDAGMRYVVITSKHHDGFCLWDSAHTDWDVGSTKNRTDVLRELAAACARHGLRFCTYHSIMDWHHPDYLPRRPWEAANRPVDGADFARFERYLHAQVAELVQRYRPAVLWFDGEWEHTWSHERGVRLFEHCRALDPWMIVNNRVDVHRGGMAGFSRAAEAVGDFATPEQEIPATGLPGVDWESCMTMNAHWGWNEADRAWKPAVELVRNLIDVASKGGNYLLNVGPRADGSFPPEAVERLQRIGAWMAHHGEAIHGTTASVFDALPWGRCTVRRDGAVTRLYLHVFDPPADRRLWLPGLANEILAVRRLGPQPASLPPGAWVGGGGTDPGIDVGDGAFDAIATVFVVEVKGEPVVHRAPRLVADGEQFVHAIDVAVADPTPGAVVRATTDGSDPDTGSPIVTGPLRLEATTTVRARSFLGERQSPIAARTFTKVVPMPAVEMDPAKIGLYIERHPGDWQRIPDDLDARPPDGARSYGAVALPPGVGERVLLRYRGWLRVPADDVYRFVLTSDDGSRLWLDGRLVVDNDGLHGPVERRGEIALARGMHAIEVVWFNRTGGAELGLSWARPGEPFSPLPDEALWH